MNNIPKDSNFYLQNALRINCRNSCINDKDIKSILSIYGVICHLEKVSNNKFIFFYENEQKFPKKSLDFHQIEMVNNIHVSKQFNPVLHIKSRLWRLKITELQPNISYESLYYEFEEYGSIHHLSMYNDENGCSASIQFAEQSSANSALANQNYHIQIKAPKQFKNTSNCHYMEVVGYLVTMNPLELMSICSKFGDVIDVHCNSMISSCDSLFSHVGFSSKSQRKAAIEALDGSKYEKNMIHAMRLIASSPFSADSGINEAPKCLIKGKHYIEFLNLPEDFSEHDLRKICCRFGQIYDVRMHVKKVIDGVENDYSHLAFCSKGMMEKALNSLKGEFIVKRVPSSSPFFVNNS